MNCAEDLALKKNPAKTIAIQSLRLELDLDDIDLADTNILESIAKLRCSVEQVATSITKHYESEDEMFDQVINEARKSLLVESESLKTFLAKEISFKHRTDIIRLMSQDDALQ